MDKTRTAPGSRYANLDFPFDVKLGQKRGPYGETGDYHTPVPPYAAYPGPLKLQQIQLRPNTRLTSLLARATARRNARLIRRSPNYPKLRDTLLWYGMRCNSFYMYGAVNEKRIDPGKYLAALRNYFAQVNASTKTLSPPRRSAGFLGGDSASGRS